MRPFSFERARDLGDACRRADAATQFLAGGTTLVDLMKLDVLRPERVIDLRQLRATHQGIEANANGVTLGAFATMSSAARHPAVLRDYPVIAQSLRLAASAQLRNMATLGGNVLQRTRCSYYRDTSWDACNKRNPGSGCAAIKGYNRNHAVLGVDDSCIAQYPGDLAVALVALDAQLDVQGPQGARRLPLSALHAPVNGQPQVETTLRPGEIITSVFVAAGPWTRRSLYLKVRDRASYEFALASAAVALDLDGDKVRAARIGLGGVAYRPWRSHAAEQALIGRTLTEGSAHAAAVAALEGARTHGYNAYKPELARQTLVRALLQARAIDVDSSAA